MSATPLILFTGMGADQRLFSPQKEAFPWLIVPPWIKPQRGEGLASYAERLAAQVDPGCPCFVGGASFGGFVAMEAARHLKAKALFLIGSVRHCRELPLRIRAMRHMKHMLPTVPFEWVGNLAGMTLHCHDDFMRPATRSVLKQVAEMKGAFMRWACRAVLTWDPPATPLGVPVFQIHGDWDRILPVKRTHPDVTLHHAGHLLSLTHANQVNHFLEEKMSAIEHQVDEAVATCMAEASA